MRLRHFARVKHEAGNTQKQGRAGRGGGGWFPHFARLKESSALFWERLVRLAAAFLSRLQLPLAARCSPLAVRHSPLPACNGCLLGPITWRSLASFTKADATAKCVSRLQRPQGIVCWYLCRLSAVGGCSRSNRTPSSFFWGGGAFTIGQAAQHAPQKNADPALTGSARTRHTASTHPQPVQQVNRHTPALPSALAASMPVGATHVAAVPGTPAVCVESSVTRPTGVRPAAGICRCVRCASRPRPRLLLFLPRRGLDLPV
jgi:hypothetical protein